MKKIVLIPLFILSFCFLSKAQYSVLLNFADSNGLAPNGSLISDGTFLYGMTVAGGAHHCGTLFKIMPDGTGYLKLLDFDSATSGIYPMGSLFFDGTYLYGMASEGGANNFGTIFKIKTDGSMFTKIFDFTGINGGAPYYNNLISDGTFLYGMTTYGGTNYDGVIFKIMPDGSSYSQILNFSGSADGMNPMGSLLYDGTFLYGMTSAGGANGIGTIFRIMPNGSGYLKLMDFAGTTTGTEPLGSLISDGTFLYGMTKYGGVNDKGVVFKIQTNGTSFTKLLDFSGIANGSFPFGSLVSDGTFLYGMTSGGGINQVGAIFKIMPDGTAYSKLYDFAGMPNGDLPFGSLFFDGNFLYGMTTEGGAVYPDGVLFKFHESPAGITTDNPENNISIYPNPATGGNVLLALNLKKEGEVKVELFSPEGKQVFSKSVSCSANSPAELAINLDEISVSAGMYIVQISASDSMMRKKLLVVSENN